MHLPCWACFFLGMATLPALCLLASVIVIWRHPIQPWSDHSSGIDLP